MHSHITEPVRSNGLDRNMLCFEIRITAAAWFGFAAVIPILFASLIFGSDFLLTFVTPILLASLFGFNFGSKILDPLVARTAISASIRGAIISLLAFLIYLSMVSMIFYGNARYGSGSIIAFVFTFGLVIVGWLVLLVGSLAGYTLFRLSLGEQFQIWLTEEPRVTKSRSRLMTFSSLIVFVSLSIVPITVNMVGLAKERRRIDLADEIRNMAGRGETEKLRAILSKEGADPDFGHIPGSPIIILASGGSGPGHEETVRMLLENGADPNRIVPYTLSALAFASGRNDVGMMRVLLDGGANVNLPSGTDSITPLMYAAPRNNTEAIKLLLESGASVNIRDRNGKTALAHLLEHRKQNDHFNPDGTQQFPDLMLQCDATASLLKSHGAID